MSEILLRQNEEGVWDEFVPYTTIAIETEEDFEEMNRRLEYASRMQWTPITEQLPKEAGFYLVTKRQRSGEIQVALGRYQPLFNSWAGNGNFKEVLAWMPIPEPYKENADD